LRKALSLHLNYQNPILMTFENLQVDIEDRIALVRINRPKKLNALNRETIEELHQAFKALRNNEDAAVVILTGSGEKAFVAGADISEFSDYSVEEGKDLAAKGQEIVFDYIIFQNQSLRLSMVLPWEVAWSWPCLPILEWLVIMQNWDFQKLH
jgi:1,4-dihydroxy-2-naphthoyl-CoA synthase